MTPAQVVETSVTNNSSFENYPHPDKHTARTTDTPGFKHIISCSCRTVVIIRCTSVFVEETPTELRIRGESDQKSISPYNINTFSHWQVMRKKKIITMGCYLGVLRSSNGYFSKDNGCFNNPESRNALSKF